MQNTTTINFLQFPWANIVNHPTTLAGYGITDGGGAGTWGNISGYLFDQVDLANALDGKADSSHGHAPADVTGTAVVDNDPRLSDARTPTAHDQAISTVTGLQTALDGKAASGHNHSGVYEPANANIQAHVVSAHAPSNAQKNSDITKGEIEAKLTGEITTHTHAGGGGGQTYFFLIDI